MRVLIAGNPPFADEIAKLSRFAHDVVRAGADDAGNFEVLVECEVASVARKREALMRLTRAQPRLVLTCALNASTTLAASWAADSQRVVGFGVLPPVPQTGTIELSRGVRTSDEALELAQAFWGELAQTTQLVGDGPGLVRARVVCCIVNEALDAVMQGVASPADIDLAMRLGTNYPLGPLAWGDAIGLDNVLGVMQALHDEFGDDRYRPSPLLRRKVAAGQSS